MKAFPSSIQGYESLAHFYPTWARPLILEAYRGTDVVRWYHAIKRQVDSLIGRYEEARNSAYLQKLREFQRVWQDHELTGSVNVENVEPLIAASRMLSADSWNLRPYFGSLLSQLDVLKASEEELPRELLTPETPAQAIGAPASRSRPGTSDLEPEPSPETSAEAELEKLAAETPPPEPGSEKEEEEP